MEKPTRHRTRPQAVGAHGALGFAWRSPLLRDQVRRRARYRGRSRPLRFFNTWGDSFRRVAGTEPIFTVLCYHQFGEQPEGKQKSLYKISRDEFRWQMKYLKDNGIIPVSLKRIRQFIEEGNPLPPRCVLITFDDGFRSIYEDAYPVLKEFGYPSALFVYTDFVASQSASLRYGEILEMMKHGMELGSHGKKHLNMAVESVKKSPGQFRLLSIRELHESAKFIQQKFGVRPDTLAYPYGVYTQVVVDEAKRVGYKLCFSINSGTNDRTISPYILRRQLVTYFTRRELFKKMFDSSVLHLKNMRPEEGGFD